MVRHRIAHNVIHAQIETGNFVGGILNLRDALDLARLVVRCGTEFDWGTLADEARDRGFFHHLSGAIYATHRFLDSPLPIPLKSLPARIHASRCVHQRQWPVANKIFENFGLLTHALAWDRNAYPLRLGTDRSLRARFLVNRRRAQRAKAILSQLRLEVPKLLNGGKRENLTEKPDEQPGWHSSVLHTPTQHALKRVFGPELAVAARERTPVLLDWAASNTFGWGNLWPEHIHGVGQ